MQEQYDLTKFDKVVADLALIKDKGNFIPDCSTPEGYEASKRFVLDVTTPARTNLNAIHKETKKPFLDACKLLDAKKNELLPTLEAVEAPHRLAYKEADRAKREAKRIQEQALEAKVQALFDFRHRILGLDSTALNALLVELEDIDTSKGFLHRKTDAIATKEVSLHIVKDALVKTLEAEDVARKQAIVAEQQRVEAERLAKVQAELDAKQAEVDRIEAEKIRAEAKAAREQREAALKIQREKDEAALKVQREKAEAKRKELEAQRKKDEEAARIAHEKEMTELAAKREAELAAEAKRLEDERVEAENALRESRTKNRNKAVKVLMADCGVNKTTAIIVLKAIAEGTVPFVSSNF